MGQQLTIESDRAYDAATRLSELTGESLTAGVTTALEERLERERQVRDREDRVRRIPAFGRDVAARVEPDASSDQSWMYDENGFPK